MQIITGKIRTVNKLIFICTFINKKIILCVNFIAYLQHMLA